MGKYRKVLVVRTRIDYLEEYLLPIGSNPRSRYERWIRILHSGNPKAKEIRNRVITEYGLSNEDESIRLFAEALQKIYGDVSDKGAHNVVDQDVLDEFTNGDLRPATELLKLLGVQVDSVYTKALKIVSQPLGVPNMDEPNESN